MKQENLTTTKEQEREAMNIQRLHEVLSLYYWAVAAGEDKKASVWGYNDWGGWDAVSVSHEHIISGTYDSWNNMLQNRCLSLDDAIKQKNEHGGGGLVANMALAPMTVICLDFDSVEGGELPTQWQAWLQSAAIERSASGKGFHAFFQVPQEFAERIRMNRDEHTGAPFKWPKTEAGIGGIDIFAGGVNRWIKVTGNAVNDWQALGSFELCAEGRAMLEEQFKAFGWFKGTEGAGRTASGAGFGSELEQLEAQAIKDLGEGVGDAAEVLRLMRQNSYANGEQGHWVKLLDGDAEAIERHYGGDWSAADCAVMREMTYYTRQAEILIDAMLETKLAARGAGYTGSPDNRNKWGRQDYQDSTLAAAYRGRLENGQTYQMQQERKAQAADMQRAKIEALPEALAAKLELTKDGSIKATLTNARLLLDEHPDFKGLIGWNDLAGRPELTQVPCWCSGRALQVGAITQNGMHLLLARMHQIGCKVKIGELDAALSTVADYHYFNPIRDKLKALQWDGMERLQSAGSTYFSLDPNYTDEERSLINKQVCKTFVGIAKRGMMQPGEVVKHDTMLVLMGAPGVRKSTAVRVIGETFGSQYFTDSLPTLRDDPKELQRAIRGLAVAEAGEMASLLHDKTGTQVLKHFITMNEDRIRENYNEHSRAVARVCVLIGTYNPHGAGFIDDFAMVRRLWPVKVGGVIDTEGLERDREQLFAEAVHLAAQGYTNYLDNDADRRLQEGLMKEFYKENCLLDAIEKQLESWNGKARPHEKSFTLTELFDRFGEAPNGLCVLAGKNGFQGVQNTMAEALRQLGYGTKHESHGRGSAKRNRKVWYKLEEDAPEFELQGGLGGTLKGPKDARRRTQDTRLQT